MFQLDPETMILPLMGSKEGIMHISMAFVNEGEEVLIPDPGYPTYSSVANLVGGKIRTYAMKEELKWGIDMEALKRLIFQRSRSCGSTSRTCLPDALLHEKN
jgi:LL-diaminopimelate aminotransferase